MTFGYLDPPQLAFGMAGEGLPDTPRGEAGWLVLFRRTHGRGPYNSGSLGSPRDFLWAPSVGPYLISRALNYGPLS